MRLGPRLAAIARFVPAGARVADIGTDHGELALALLRDVACQVIATDRSPRALAMAAATLRDADRTRFQLRCGDGLHVLAPGEVDTVVLAGMGGGAIVRILDARADLVETLARIVVQPERHWATVRRWIATQRATLVDEVLVRDGARFRLVCAIEPDRRGAHEWCERDLWMGPRLRAQARPVWCEWLRHQLRTMDRALDDAGRANAPAERLRARRAAFADELARVAADGAPPRLPALRSPP